MTEVKKKRLPRKLKKAIKNGKYGLMRYIDASGEFNFKPEKSKSSVKKADIEEFLKGKI